MLQKKVYGKELTDWTARHHKNKLVNDRLNKEIETLRKEVLAQREEIRVREEAFAQLEQNHEDAVRRLDETKAASDSGVYRKGELQVDLSDARKHKVALTKERKTLVSDYDRKHAELVRTYEIRDQLEKQAASLSRDCQQISSERSKQERQLSDVLGELRTHTDLTYEVNREMDNVWDGVKNAVGQHMAPVTSPTLGARRLPNQLPHAGGGGATNGR